MTRWLAWLGLSLALISLAPDGDGKGDQGRERNRDPEVGRSYQIPYRVTHTNHFLVRVRINGKGPFNFLVDTGAPALYIATETARKVGVEPLGNEFWTAVARLDFEGGAWLTNIRARVEDPFQLVGMNALGLPGASIDGILGFTVLARFRIELDPTRDRMTWTRLAFEPSEPPVPSRAVGQRGGPGSGLQGMNLLGPLARIIALLTGGKQPEDQLIPRGFLGLELTEAAGEVRVAAVLANSPAARAGVRPGDLLVRLLDRDVTSIKAAREAIAGVRPDDRVALVVRRGANAGTEDLTLTMTAGEGL
jgi:membrane-associated protease RseP (regulator of RpoE activity)